MREILVWTWGCALALSAAAQQQRPAVLGVSHLAVYTSDPGKSEYFYVHDLGAQKAPDPENAQGARYYFNATQFVEVLPLPAGWTSVSRFDHAGFRTTDAEQLRVYLKSQRVAVPQAVTRGSDGSVYFEVKDPEGNRVEFVQPPATPLTVPVNQLSHRILHVGYIVHDVTAENTFYHDLLGFRAYWTGGMTDQSDDWTALQVPDGTDWIEYMQVKGPEKTGLPAGLSQSSAGVMNHFAPGVPNIESAVELLVAGDRFNAKHSDPKIGRDGKWQVNMYDPDGTRAEMMEFQPKLKPCCSPFLLPSPTE